MTSPLYAANVAALLDRLCAEHGLAVPCLEWSQRMRRSLGRAFSRPPTIRLSAWLDEEQASATLRHELAHVAVYAQAKKGRKEAPHGPLWREWCERLGASAARDPPANAAPSSAAATGLVCDACGQRFVRRRVIRGLYHGDCGPRRGRLRRVLRGDYAEVTRWANAPREEQLALPGVGGAAPSVPA
ncbi:MAG: SprT-like domain-containing protein [Dehalococcoidia bacterium]|nr:SprT-like domain-containing protein [Dehalococcoidia bacterium]